MKNYILKNVILLVAFISLPIAAKAISNAYVNGIYYNVYVNGHNQALAIVSNPYYIGPYSYEYEPVYSGVVDIPEEVTYEGVTYTVTSISEYAFYLCSDLTQVNIPNTVTEIGQYAFSGCTNLQNANLPTSLKAIRLNAFADCPLMKLPDEVFPSGLKTIETGAFQNCSSITGAILPDEMDNLGQSVFEGCTSLLRTRLPSNLRKISKHLFCNCESLNDVEIPYDEEQYYWYWVEIEESAFEGCSSLERITLPRIVSWVNFYAFKSCTNLKEVIIDNPNITILAEAFAYCSSLNSIYFPNVIQLQSFYGCNSLTEIELLDNVTSLRDQCFANCENLHKITIGKNVSYIAKSGVRTLGVGNVYYTSLGAFNECSNIDTVVYNAKLLREPNFAPMFPHSKLKSIVFGDEVTQIPWGICSGQTELTEINLPQSVKTVDEYSFDGCTGLTNVTLPAGLVKIKDYAFKGCSGLTRIEIPTWANICEGAFSGCSNLNEVIFNDEKISYLKKGAFTDCTSLTSVILPNSIEELGDSVFAGCENLSIVSIPLMIGGKEFPRHCFTGCPLEKIYCYAPTPPSVSSSYSDTDYFDSGTFSEAILYVPKGCKDLYAGALMWKNFVDIQEMNWDANQWDAITSIEGDKQVKSIRYFNLAGVESAEPQPGMNIKVTTYTDGTRSSEKVIK